MIERNDRWAVLIGINGYHESLGRLKYSVNDCRRLAEVLTTGDDAFPADHVLVLTDDEAAERKPTYGNIHSWLASWLAQPDEDDTVLVFFAGHGREMDGKCYLVPADATLQTIHVAGIPVPYVQELLNRCKARQKVLVLDACHSGAGRDVSTMAAPMMETLSSGKGIYTLTSCDVDELSHEWEEKKQGVFSYYLAEALSGSCPPDAHGRITAEAVYDWTFESVRSWSARHRCSQNPQRFSQGKGAIVIHSAVRASGDSRPHIPTEGPRSSVASGQEQAISDSREYCRLMVSQSSRNVFISDHASNRLAVWQQAADSGAADGVFLVGLCCEFGAGMAKDTKHACQLYKQAAVMGHAPSQFALGCQVQKTDPAEAARLWRSAADQQYSPAMFMLGKAHVEGIGVKPDGEKATEWFRRASEFDDPSAQCVYGLRLAEGDGVGKDESEAKTWLEKAARAGKERARKALEVLAGDEGAAADEVSRNLTEMAVPAKRRLCFPSWLKTAGGITAAVLLTVGLVCFMEIDTLWPGYIKHDQQTWNSLAQFLHSHDITELDCPYTDAWNSDDAKQYRLLVTQRIAASGVSVTHLERGVSGGGNERYVLKLVKMSSSGGHNISYALELHDGKGHTTWAGELYAMQ